MTQLGPTPETSFRIVMGADPKDHIRRRFPADCAAVLEWVYDYVSEPHRDLGRLGPVCPFVPPALKDGSLVFSVRYDVTGADRTHIVETLVAEMDAFDAAAPPLPQTGIQLHSRLVSYPLLEIEGWQALDDAYLNLKDRAVQRGLMVGQFHPACKELAIRNPAFRVSRAPHALVAMRRMAPHDILFLHDNPLWFALYRERFGDYVDSGRLRDPVMRASYASAVAAHLVNQPYRRTSWTRHST